VWCRTHGVPALLFADSNARTDFAKGFKLLIKRVLLGGVMRLVSGVLVCGSLGAQFYTRYGAKASDLFYVPYEPDYDLIHAVSARTTSEALARFGLDGSRKRFVACSRLVDYKCVDKVVDAFQGIAAERPEFDLIIIGDGPEGQRLKDRVKPELKNRVVFTGFVGEQATIAGLYKGSHVFVHAAEDEPWGVVINESAAAGMAIVSSDVVGAAAELVRDKVNGRVFPVNNLQALVECMRDASDPANLERYRSASAGILADWRERGDPIKGLRKALAHAGMGPGPGTAGSAEPV
jgi:glycosyltransferase involved in cell wall biosynthesis